MSNLCDTYRVPIGPHINTLISNVTVAREPQLPWKRQFFFKLSIIAQLYG